MSAGRGWRMEGWLKKKRTGRLWTPRVEADVASKQTCTLTFCAEHFVEWSAHWIHSVHWAYRHRSQTVHQSSESGRERDWGRRQNHNMMTDWSGETFPEVSQKNVRASKLLMVIIHLLSCTVVTLLSLFWSESSLSLSSTISACLSLLLTQQTPAL